MTDVIVRAAVVPMQSRPAASSEQVSQTLGGHRLTVMEREEPWLRVRSRDGYEGWIHRGYVEADGATGYARRLTSLGCVVRFANESRRLPLGALVPDDAELVRGEALGAEELSHRFPRSGGAIARSAVELYQGTSYEWGGITPWGADCSGFAQTIYQLHDVALPRDASQQATVGDSLDAPIDALHPADLLFFSDRPDHGITHVAIALGGDRIVHLALGRGGYQVEKLSDSADPYVQALRERYRFARRVL
jgi:hypothetical protein